MILRCNRQDWYGSFHGPVMGVNDHGSKSRRYGTMTTTSNVSTGVSYLKVLQRDKSANNSRAIAPTATYDSLVWNGMPLKMKMGKMMRIF